MDDSIDTQIFKKLKERMKTKFPILLAGYIRDSKTYLVTIETNLPQGNLNDLISAVHCMKSASGLLGITRVCKAAGTLEYAGKGLQDGDNTHSLMELYQDLQYAFSDVESVLQAELAALS